MKSHLVLALKILVSVLLVGLLLHTVDPAPVLARMGHASLAGMTAALALALGQIALVGWRWQIILRTCKTPLTFFQAQTLTFIGQFFNQTLPSTIGGDVVRVFMAGKLGVPKKRGTSSVIADRVVALLALMLLSTITLPLFRSIIANPPLRDILTLVLVTGFGGFAFGLALGKKMAALIPIPHISTFFHDFTHDMRTIMPKSRDSILIWAVALATHLTTVTTVFLLARIMGIPLEFGTTLVLIPPVILFMILPVSLAGWGIREGAMVFILGQIGIPAADALALSLAFGLLISIAGLPGGALWILHKGKLPHDT